MTVGGDFRLLVASNFGDSSEIQERARKLVPTRRRVTREAPPLVTRLLAGAQFRTRSCISPESSKLETTVNLTVNSLVGDHPWCTRKLSLTRGGRLREKSTMLAQS